MTRPVSMMRTTRVLIAASAASLTLGATALPRPTRPASAAPAVPAAPGKVQSLPAVHLVEDDADRSTHVNAPMTRSATMATFSAMSNNPTAATSEAVPAPLIAAWVDSFVVRSVADGQPWMDVVTSRDAVSRGLVRFDASSAAWRADTVRLPVGTTVYFTDAPLHVMFATAGSAPPLLLEQRRQIFDGKQLTWFACASSSLKWTMNRATASAPLKVLGAGRSACAKTRPDTPAGAQWADSITVMSAQRGAEWVDLVLPRDVQTRGLVRFETPSAAWRGDTVRVPVGTLMRVADAESNVLFASPANAPELMFVARGQRNLDVIVHEQKAVYVEKFRCVWTAPRIRIQRKAALVGSTIAIDGAGRNECWDGIE